MEQLSIEILVNKADLKVLNEWLNTPIVLPVEEHKTPNLNYGWNWGDPLPN